MLIGYARVSKDEQNLDLQTDALTAAGVEKFFTDKMSGAKADRKGLADALSHLRKGDVLVVWKLDRLGRGTLQLMMLLNQLHERGVECQGAGNFPQHGKAKFLTPNDWTVSLKLRRIEFSLPAGGMIG